MELDFDKEINALLRQAAKDGGRTAAVGRQNDGNPQSHLDADEISAFAENALPEKTRNVYIKHFADCDRCRTILSNTILLNSEAETETASSAAGAPVSEIVAEKIPWYRKMFLMPNLAYTMGGLVLVFGGMLGFLVLQNLNKSGVSDVSQIQEKAPPRSGGPNAGDGNGISYNSTATASNSNAMTSNTAAMANSSSNSAAGTANATANDPQLFPSDKPLIQPTVPTEPQQNAAKPTADDALSTAKNESRDAKDARLGDKNKAAETARNEEIAKSTDESVTVAPPAPKAGSPQPSITTQRNEEELPLNGRRTQNLPQVAPSEKKSDRAISGATNNSRQIGGKIFSRAGGVWIDSAYNKSNSSNMSLPRTKTIRRGSSEYQKLDKQIRIIAESLDGAVVIVWGSIAYRIQ